MLAIAIFLTISFVFFFYRSQRISSAEVVFRFKIFELRDELRRLAINGELDEDQYLFDYLDRAFSQAVKSSYFMSIPYLLYLTLKHVDISEKPLEEKAQAANPVFVELIAKYISAQAAYLKAQHLVTWKIKTS